MVRDDNKQYKNSRSGAGTARTTGRVGQFEVRDVGIGGSLGVMTPGDHVDVRGDLLVDAILV